jgi:hypothetical protein
MLFGVGYHLRIVRAECVTKEVIALSFAKAQHSLPDAENRG